MAVAFLAAMAVCACSDSTSDGGGGNETPDAGPGPSIYDVRFETTVGEFVVEVHRDWAPIGADRFRRLVAEGFYDGCRFFRVLPGFVVQWGLNGDPAINAEWEPMTLVDDPILESNVAGTVTFAMAAQPNTRSTQIFINYADNLYLDGFGFTPFAQVTSGLAVAEMINAEYREEPDQRLIRTQGDTYLDSNFPNLDKIIRATLVDGD